MNLSVKESLKSVNIWQSYSQEYSGSPFLTHSVYSRFVTMHFIVMHIASYLMIYISKIAIMVHKLASQGANAASRGEHGLSS